MVCVESEAENVINYTSVQKNSHKITHRKPMFSYRRFGVRYASVGFINYSSVDRFIVGSYNLARFGFYHRIVGYIDFS